MISKVVFSASPEVSSDVTRSRRQWRVPWRWFQPVFATALMLTMAVPSLGADTARTVSQQRLAEFRRTYSVKSLLMDKNGTPETVAGTLSTGLKAGSAYEQVLAFLEGNRDVFRMRDPRSEWKLLRDHVEARTGLRHLRLQQVYHGLEVDGVEMTAHFSRTGQLTLIGSSYIPGIDLPSVPTVGEEEAQRIVTQDVSSTDSLDLSRCRLIVYPWEGRCYLAWQIVSIPGGRYEVDALTGNIISRDPRNAFPKMRVIDSVPPLRREPIGVPPTDSPNGPHSGPVGEPVDTIPPAPGSPPGSPRGVMFRPIINGVRRDSLHIHRGWLVKPPDLPPAPVDTNPQKKSPSPPKQQSQSAQEPESLVTIMTEGFESIFPSGNWQLYGSPTWDDDDCRAHTGSWSAWCANSGGLDPCPITNYPNNLNAWMTYGPFDLSDAKAAELSFWYWLSSEPGYDSLFWGASHDGASFYGEFDDGYSPGWVRESFPLCDYIGDNSVWVGFRFKSDGSMSDLGAFVDDILVQKRTDGQPDLTGYTPTGWSYAIVASSVRGTHTSDVLEVGDTAFIDVAWQNSGVACAGSHRARLLFNAVPIWTSTSVTLSPAYYYWFEDIPYAITVTGTDLLRLEIDIDNSVPESDETNNTSNLFFDVGCWPGRAVGTGCSVVPGVSHPGVEAYCNGAMFELTDWSRIPGGTNYLKSYWCVDSTVVRLYTDRDNIWEDASAHQCEGVDAHVYSGLTYDYMRDVFDRNSYDSAGASMKAAVDNPLSGLYNNTAWDTLNEYVMVGLPGPGRRSIAGCLDAIAHEWGHAITQNASRLVPEKESGALSESFSDMLGVSVGFEYTDPDYLLGEDSYTSGQAMRNMADPLQYNQPDTYHGTNWVVTDPCVPLESNDYCGVHKNSGVPNKMFYLLAHGGTHNGIIVTGIGVPQAMYIMYYANTNYWRSHDSLTGAMRGSIQAAYDIDPSGGWERQVTRAWAAVGICDCPNQGDVINDDAAVDVFDVIREIGIAFSGEFNPQDPGCPTTRGDVINNDLAVDVFDVIREIQIAFSGGVASDPCAPTP